MGVVGWSKGVVYLTSPGRPTDIGLQLGKACYLSLAAGEGKGRMFLFLLFLHFHSFSSFSSVLLFHLLYCLFYLSSPFLWETTQNDPQGLLCHLTTTQSILFFFCFFTFIHSFFSVSPVPLFISSTISSIFSLSLEDDTKWPTRTDVSLKPQHNQSII